MADSTTASCPICVTCGTQYAASTEPPAACAICTDDRQFVGEEGQQWTSHEALCREYRNAVAIHEERLTSIKMEPGFATCHRAFFIGTDEGNVLWDCLPLLDEAVYQLIRCANGLEAIAISHPHFYSSAVEWSRAFDGVPIWLHADDRQWVQRPDERMVFWEGDSASLPGGLTLVRCGGHFPGSAVLHWPSGATGEGALFTGDSINVVQDRRWVSFMYSFPNLIPLSARAVRRIESAVQPYAFDRIYGAFGTVDDDAKNAIRRSAERYCRALSGAARD